ncbi:hypothetical protein GCM10008959_25920 [Deinococcus seoulensis]|uniref:Uncharacterized protein n=1 Tax=Deinococcus seoulensis TaxID=1837379 RepID=A0ABQ2RSJ6_9DEIO|nr:hypothetical protein [Deinococcus seoulensis]GGR62697.1 hypothetical protein GCM10008959_25920 [Deinococcus seoulensis]
MDVLTAHNARGYLHAVTCDHPAGLGELFARTMRAQGCIVTRRSMADHLAQIAAGRAGHAPTDSPAQAVTPDLPEVGASVTVPHLGAGVVITLLAWPDGTRAALVRARNGESLARPGQWTPLDTPAQPTQDAPSPEPPMQPPDPPLPDAPVLSAPTCMPTLFGEWSPA